MKETRQRVLDAALKVFSRDGVSGATTREIARVARVNEVTLFRYFKNKNELLRQAVLCSAARYEQVFAEASLGSPEDLRRTVVSYAQAYANKLRENEDLVRTFMGELTRHLKLCRSLFVESAKASRQKFIAYLRAAQKAGLVRRDLDPETATDALTGMLMSGALRRPLTEPYYSSKRYVETCVELFLKGIAR
ncbi:MAG TPA: TetR/AcrR family transcriptional regulator [Candidatus Methylacidiphilales bacterium]|jgi:AcrR family transcriptional regulator|nr:TetR/AcrR family transcriptional regulator [Candidatus Methylacidiphilales bacterium]